jgi:conserved hypothetical protein, phage tail-like region
VRYGCCDERRLQAVKEAGSLNGIEYLEVSDSEAPSEALRQRTLFVRLLDPAPGLTLANVTIGGGERINVGIEWIAPATTPPAGEDPALVADLRDPATILLVRTDSQGDFSTYTLQLVAGAGSDVPPAGFDPQLASVDFSFKVECDADFDCTPVCTCPVEPAVGPEIDYLAKDFYSFRSLMLDRLSLLAPDWIERSPADAGIALVETLAYLADELSYRQDAVATEAYLATARRRTSLRRHARLVDYVMHDGSNARTWARLTVDAEAVPLDRGTALLTRVADVPAIVKPDDADHRAALAADAETFETAEATLLYKSHRRFDFWTWGDAGCCLPEGATSATLVGRHPNLKAGDVLVLVEVASPTTGQAGDADPAKRAAVRLTKVEPSTDPSGGLFADPPTTAALLVTEIAWDEEDELRFPLCVSVEARPALVVSEAWGNIVLADHGRTVKTEPLGETPAPVLAYGGASPCDDCGASKAEPVPARFRPVLASRPLTHAKPLPTREIAQATVTPALVVDLVARTFSPLLHDWLEARGVTFRAGPAVVRGGDGRWSVSDGVIVALLRLESGMLFLSARPASASATLVADPRRARPSICLDGTLLAITEEWRSQVDLLGSAEGATDFVVEIEEDATARLRFGDGVHGRRPDATTTFEATYRVGNGRRGNIGANALAHVATTQSGILAIENPIPAAGGTEPEAADAVRRDAPEAFLVQERAVTEYDYARVTERSREVQRATAAFRWTGSWHTVFVTADRAGGLDVDDEFEVRVRRHIEPFRMAGYDLEVDGPRFVPLDIGLRVCVMPEYFRAHVEAAVLNVLSSRVRSDGSLGLFHPDRWTFGQPVYLSAIVAAVQAVEGVESVTTLTFERQRDHATTAIDAGVLMLARLEIPQLDNDPTFPDRGLLALTMGGGK